MGKIRRKFEADFKRQVIGQIEAGELTLARAARDYQLAHSVLERWRSQYRNNRLTNAPSVRERQLEAENEKLKAKIGDLVMQMEYLKKLQAWVQQQRSADTSVITSKSLDRFRKPAK
jgi:transposase-like protein